jgi:hypothetical protein
MAKKPLAGSMTALFNLENGHVVALVVGSLRNMTTGSRGWGRRGTNGHNLSRRSGNKEERSSLIITPRVLLLFICLTPKMKMTNIVLIFAHHYTGCKVSSTCKRFFLLLEGSRLTTQKVRIKTRWKQESEELVVGTLVKLP